jgi:flagellar basal-body rod protein FlgC
MNLFRSIDTSASGLTAQRLRMDIISNNLANVNTTRTSEIGADGKPVPYRRQMAIFESRQPEFSALLSQKMSSNDLVGNGVKVVGVTKDPEPFKMMYNPNHPDANNDGYVLMPNVNVVTEMVDMISATRAYEANVTAINSAKNMAAKALEIGRG